MREEGKEGWRPAKPGDPPASIYYPAPSHERLSIGDGIRLGVGFWIGSMLAAALFVSVVLAFPVVLVTISAALGQHR